MRCAVEKGIVPPTRGFPGPLYSSQVGDDLTRLQIVIFASAVIEDGLGVERLYPPQLARD